MLINDPETIAQLQMAFAEYEQALVSNDVPTLPQWTGAGSLRDPGLNVANYDNAVGWNGQVGNLTTVGSAGSGSETAWGAADMGGNAYEWVESIVTGSMRGLRGGGWNDPASMLHKMHRGSNAPTNKYSTVGFRVAMRQVW